MPTAEIGIAGSQVAAKEPDELVAGVVESLFMDGGGWVCRVLGGLYREVG